jgi:hypothetical protein
MLTSACDNGPIDRGGKMKYEDLTEERKSKIAAAKAMRAALYS